MSHSPVSYIDGVPVKISERYKPPPKISLPQRLVQCLAECNNALDRVDDPDAYDFDVEREHLRQVSAWKNTRNQERFARRQRIHQREVTRQREDDERQKQRLTAVSYPSADELSSDGDGEGNGDGDDDEDDDADGLKTATTNSSAATSTLDESISGHTTAETTPHSHNEPPSQPPPQRFDTILVPTIMPSQAPLTDGDSNWSFASKLTNGADGAARVNSVPIAVKLSKINWSDFESDTSSPFDNIALHAINDLDILAQVLNLNADADATKPTTSPPTTCDNEHSTDKRHQTVAATGATSTIGTSTTTITHSAAPTQPVNVDNVLNSNDLSAPALACHAPAIYNQTASYYGTYAPQYAPYSNQLQNHQHQQPHHGGYAPLSGSPTMADNAGTTSPYNSTQPGQYHFNYHQQQASPVAPQTLPITHHNGTRYAASYGSNAGPGSNPMQPTAMRDFDGIVGAFKSNSVPDILRLTAGYGATVGVMGSTEAAKRLSDNATQYGTGGGGGAAAATGSATSTAAGATTASGTMGSMRYF